MRDSRASLFFTTAASLLLAGCGGGSGGQVQSTPTPVSAPTPTPVSTPTASGVNFDTAEYRSSSGPSFHGAITAYQAGASGAGITVGIVDSGLSDAAGEFVGRISPLSRDFGGNASFADVGGHGTAVAEVLAGARNDAHVQGMAWGATVMALRTDKPGSCTGSGCEHTSSAMAQAVDYAWRNGARIINISLGGEINSSDLLAAVSRATAAGTIVVVAAGNAKTGEAARATPNLLATSLASPATGHGLVIVATSVGHDGIVSSFSNGAQGYERTSLSALGDAVPTIDHKGTDLLYTGTSFSAPQIAGAAALLAQAFPNLSSAQIVQLLLSTARDAGATGPDSLYGMGILDVARAFQPQGTMSLAGSVAALSAGDPTLLSTAMGDATPAGLAAVLLDSYRRPFETDLSSGMERPGLRGRLTGALAGRQQQIGGMAGPISLNLSVTSGRPSLLDQSPGGAHEAQTRLVSGQIGTRISERATLAIGLRSGLDDLAPSLDGRERPAFLVADAGSLALAPELRPDSSLAWRQALGNGFALVGGMEAGSLEARWNRPGLAPSSLAGRDAHYGAVLSAVSLNRGRMGLTTGVRLVDERGSMLGARFTPALGAQSARSLFASLDLRFEPAAGLTLGASMQRGWTYAAAGGALDEGGLLRTRSWSIDAAHRSLFARGDLFGLRISAPLRVTSSRFDLNLPQSWDWESETATTARTPLALVPRGSERDYELSYGLGMSGGWLGANLFMRSQTGNVATMPDDYGAALRWSARW